MRLFRGISKNYDPKEVRDRCAPGFISTDFTECPYAALQYASGPKGVVLVLDLPDDLQATGVYPGLRVSEETWAPGQTTPKRLVVWGKFDEFLRAVIPGRALRAKVRKKGIVGLPDRSKSSVLSQFIEEFLHDRVPASLDRSI